MRLSSLIYATSFVLATACASDGSIGPNTPVIETRLSAVATVTSAVIGDPTVTLRVAITSALNENVQGGVCAQIVEARVAGGEWADVTATGFACTAQAVLLAPGQTINVTAVADQAKMRQVAGSVRSVSLRARHGMAGTSTNYTLQSSEVMVQM